MQAAALVSPANAQHKASQAIGCQVTSLFWPVQSWSDLAGNDVLAVPRSHISDCRLKKKNEMLMDWLFPAGLFTKVLQYFNILKSFQIFLFCFLVFGRQLPLLEPQRPYCPLMMNIWHVYLYPRRTTAPVHLTCLTQNTSSNTKNQHDNKFFIPSLVCWNIELPKVYCCLNSYSLHSIVNPSVLLFSSVFSAV